MSKDSKLNDIKSDKNFIERYRVLSPFDYVLYFILFSVPFVGLIFILYFSFGGTKNVNLKNFALSFIYVFLLVICFYLIIILMLFLIGIIANF